MTTLPAPPELETTAETVSVEAATEVTIPTPEKSTVPKPADVGKSVDVKPAESVSLKRGHSIRNCPDFLPGRPFIFTGGIVVIDSCFLGLNC